MNRITPAPQVPIAPNTSEIAAYLDMVFGYTSGFVPVRLLTEKGTPPGPPRSLFHAVGSTLAARIQDLAQQAAGLTAGQVRGVFVVPGTVAVPGSARAADIAEMAVVLIDIDHGQIAAKRDHLERYLGPPSMVVASGGRTQDGEDKLHLYWRLTEPVTGSDLNRLCQMRCDIARKVGGDPAFDSLHQPIRVPGSLHGKFGRLTPVRILDHRPIDTELDDLAEAIASMPILSGLANNPGLRVRQAKPVGTETLMTQIVREDCQDGISRFEALSKVIGHWIRQVRQGRATLGDARRGVEEYNAAMIRPSWPVERLEREFAALLKRDIEQSGALETFGADVQPPPPDMVSGGRNLSAVSAPRFSEDDLAADFVSSAGQDWRQVSTWGAWMHWSGSHWIRDDVIGIRDVIRHVCRRASSDADSPTEARRIASARTLAAVERIAASDPLVSASPALWDAGVMLLNTAGGIVDLGTGVVAPHDRDAMMTQIAGAAPGHACPRWISFLDEITGGNQDFIAYLARVCGYCLTGSTREQVFFFLHGQGANGKSVFLQILTAVLGTYAATAALDTFMASSSERHSTDLAGLRGARLVTVAETEAGRAWAESRIKTITGGDPIRVRFMHQNYFEFVPTFKLIVVGNHRPHLQAVGEAMRRRLHLVPFEVVIPPERRDHNLTARLKQELDGILGWMLAGCAEWQRIGLCPPSVVSDAVTNYIADEDMIGQWIAEQCVIGPEARAASGVLFGSWCRFADRVGIARSSQKALGDALRLKGCQPIRTATLRGWTGIALRTPDGVED